MDHHRLQGKKAKTLTTIHASFESVLIHGQYSDN